MTIKVKGQTLLCILILCHAAAAQGLAQRLKPGITVEGEIGSRLDQYLTKAAADGFSGAALVAKDGQVILAKGYGLADRQRDIPVTAETLFDIGSITKQFTAAAILKLEMQNKLNVKDLISKYLKDVPADKAGITIHHLLTHSAGFAPKLGEDYEAIGRDEYVRRALSSNLLFAPGAKHSYSNVGYSLLGVLIELQSGKPYERFLRESLFKPTGMRQTGYRLAGWQPEAVAHGYKDDKDWGTPLTKLWAADGPYWHLRANGGLLSTVGDLFRWHQALEGERVLSKEAKQKYFAPHIAEDEQGESFYGYGWVISTTPRKSMLVMHNGGNGVFFADFHRYVDEKVVVIFLTNDFKRAWRDKLPLSWQLSKLVFAPAR